MKTKILAACSLAFLVFTSVEVTASIIKNSADDTPMMCFDASQDFQTSSTDCAAQNRLLACNQTTCEQNCYNSRSTCFNAGRDDCDIAYDQCKKNCQAYCN